MLRRMTVSRACLLMLILVLFSHAARDAHAQRATDPASKWRQRVLGNEHPRHMDPRKDFEGMVGPLYIYKDGHWFTGDLRLVYLRGEWVSAAQLTERRVVEERVVATRPAPRPARPEGD